MQTPYMGLILFISLLIGFVNSEWPICGDQDDCGEGYTCLGGTCTECLTCGLILRKGGSCVTDFGECGDCLQGYEEMPVTFFSSTARPCKPTKQNVKFKECTSSKSCPPNNYCIEDSCVECFDCAVVNRLPSVGGCAKGLIECGSCINGFSEAAVTTGTNYTRCQRGILIKKLQINTLFVSCIMALGCFLFFILLPKIAGKILGKSNHKISSSTKVLASAPPFQDVENQFYSPNALETPTNPHVEVEQMQQALPFQQPNTLYYPMRLEVEEGEPPRGNNSNTHHASYSDSLQEHLPLATFTPVSDESQEQDSTDSGEPAANGINSEGLINGINNDSVSGTTVTPELS